MTAAAPTYRFNRVYDTRTEEIIIFRPVGERVKLELNRRATHVEGRDCHWAEGDLRVSWYWIVHLRDGALYRVEYLEVYRTPTGVDTAYVEVRVRPTPTQMVEACRRVSPVPHAMSWLIQHTRYDVTA